MLEAKGNVGHRVIAWGAVNEVPHRIVRLLRRLVRLLRVDAEFVGGLLPCHNRKKEELDESIEDWGADVTTLTNNLETTIEEKNKIVSDYDVKIDTLNLKISDLTNEILKLEKDLEKKTDDKYKKFWEDEIESHDKTKEEINVLKETINQLKGNTNNGDDIYGSDEKGWWSGGSNLMGKK